jgi:hypothetical protein
MSLFKIHVTSPDFKKRRTDRHFCNIGTTNAVLDYSLCGATFLVIYSVLKTTWLCWRTRMDVPTRTC